MTLAPDNFPRLAIAAFDWLRTDHAFAVDSSEVVRNGSREFFASVRWKSPRMWVEVILEIPRPALDVQFGPLLNGRMPPIEDVDNRFHLDALVAFSEGAVALPLHQPRKISEREVTHALEDASRALNTSASRMFRGDHRVLSEMREYSERIRQSKREQYHPGKK